MELEKLPKPLNKYYVCELNIDDIPIRFHVRDKNIWRLFIKDRPEFISLPSIQSFIENSLKFREEIIMQEALYQCVGCEVFIPEYSPGFFSMVFENDFINMLNKYSFSKAFSW